MDPMGSVPGERFVFTENIMAYKKANHNPKMDVFTWFYFIGAWNSKQPNSFF